MEFVNELCSSRETGQINDYHSPADADVQILSPPRTHVKSLKFAGVTDLVPRDLSPQGDTPKPAPINNYMHSGQKLTSRGSITMSPIEVIDLFTYLYPYLLLNPFKYVEV